MILIKVAAPNPAAHLPLPHTDCAVSSTTTESVALSLTLEAILCETL